MKYFKNTELAKLYNVSEKSVRNWIDAAESGKLNLELCEQNGKSYVANTVKNEMLIKEIVQKNKKYKNSRGVKTVVPTDAFYENYSHKQILDIISNLTNYQEIPTLYSYSDGGATYWDEYALRLVDEQTPNILTSTIKLLDMNSRYIDSLIENYQKVNVIDLGPGNGLPLKQTLTRLLENKKLNRYIAIDGSKEMLSILENNVKEWFGGAVKFEGYVRDFGHERFNDLLHDDMADGEAMPINLVFVLGGTLNNFRLPDHALRTINASIGTHDLTVFAGYLDTPSTRRYFDFNASSSSNQKRRSLLILDFMGISEAMYDVERKFNPESSARSTCIIPKIDLNVKISLPKGTRTVELRKGEPILLWRHWHKDTMATLQQFAGNGFDIMQMTKSTDEQHYVLTSKIKGGISY